MQVPESLTESHLMVIDYYEKIVRTYWMGLVSPGVSRPTDNKSHIKRVRRAKVYASPMKYVLEMTQTEVLLALKEKHQTLPSLEGYLKN